MCWDGIAQRAPTCHDRGVPLIWLILGVALVVAEVFTATFVLLMFGIGALAAALVALLGAGAAWQALAFAGVSTLSLVLVRPGIQHFMHRHSPKTPMGLAAIEGGTALVLEEICADSGLVKIEGEIWRARPYDARQVIPAGEQVRVIEVDGATAMVWRD
ncbi:MAG: NfeD family protein [Dactylosporangium sp.]|nr:NfeD family protein [Dactylosporangium sp.]NNJ62208.1 NfeD family protein [Dactylosporangium sp.]